MKLIVLTWFGLVGFLLGVEPPLADLGKQIFLDTALSNPPGQGCISCHSPKAAFADPRRVSPGAMKGRMGRRNAPSLMYAALIPPQRLEDTYDENGELEYIVEGGLFLDGRAHDLLDQVRHPFFDKNEMNIADEEELAGKLRKRDYGKEFEGLGDKEVNEKAFEALVAFLREPLFRPFNARIDEYWAGNKEALSLSERRGLDVFQTSGGCATCHLTGVASWPKPLLTDSGFDNLGAPAIGKIDPGLGGITGKTGELGQFKVPSLRNVALTAPYLHNGSIQTLKEVMEFYNKRDLEPERWGVTNYPGTVNHEDMGNLELTDQEVDDLVALMDAFTDRTLVGIPEGRIFPEVPPGVPTTEERKAFFIPKRRHDLTAPRRPGAE
ncbi:MAG: cytochrome c peroxidase [Akkermansiaceae bacterium]